MRRLSAREHECTCRACAAPTAFEADASTEGLRVARLPIHMVYGRPGDVREHVVVTVAKVTANGRFLFHFADGERATSIEEASACARKRMKVTVLRRADCWKEWYVFDGTNHTRADGLSLLPAHAGVDVDALDARTCTRAATRILRPAPTHRNPKRPVVDERATRVERRRMAHADAAKSPPTPGVHQASHGDDDERAAPPPTDRPVNLRAVPACRWDHSFLPTLLAHPERVPDMKAVRVVDDDLAECDFVHPDGTIVPIVVPLCSIYYVEKYASLLAPIKRYFHDA